MIRQSERIEPPVAVILERLRSVEAELANAARTELRVAFDRFFDAWFDRLYSLASHLSENDEKLAQRITMELFVRSLRSVANAPES